MRQLRGHKKDVRAVAYTPDGRVVSAGSDRTVRVWDAATGECLTVVRAKAPVYAVAASTDGTTIAYAGRYAPRADANYVHLCDPAGKPIAQLELATEANQLEQVPGTFQFRTVLRAEPRSIWSLAFSADGEYLAACCHRIGGGGISNGGGAFCWSDADGRATPDVTLAEDAYAVAFAPAGRRIAVTRTRAVAFHDDPAGPETLAYPLTSDWAAAVAFVPGADLAVVGSNSFLVFVNPAKQEKPTRLKTGVRTVAAVAASPDGKALLVGGHPGAVEVYDVATRALVTSYDFGIGGVHAVAYAPDGLTFAAAGHEGLAVCDAAG